MLISAPMRGIKYFCNVQGTRDVYPEDMLLRNWLFTTWRRTAEQFGFVEYDAPVVESEQLYTRKGGEEIVQQLYNFVDKSNRRLALRPEMTPSLARMILSKPSVLQSTLKWFSIPQCWRYERMARGRRRFAPCPCHRDHDHDHHAHRVLCRCCTESTISGIWIFGACRPWTQRQRSLLQLCRR